MLIQGDEGKGEGDGHRGGDDGLARHDAALDVNVIGGLVPIQVAKAGEVVIHQREAHNALGNRNQERSGGLEGVNIRGDIARASQSQGGHGDGTNGHAHTSGTVGDGGQSSDRELVDSHMGRNRTSIALGTRNLLSTNRDNGQSVDARLQNLSHCRGTKKRHIDRRRT